MNSSVLPFFRIPQAHRTKRPKSFVCGSWALQQHSPTVGGKRANQEVNRRYQAITLRTMPKVGLTIATHPTAWRARSSRRYHTQSEASMVTGRIKPPPKVPAPLAVRSSPFWTPKWTPARRNCAQAIERIDEERVRTPRYTECDRFLLHALKP